MNKSLPWPLARSSSDHYKGHTAKGSSGILVKVNDRPSNMETNEVL